MTSKTTVSCRSCTPFWCYSTS